MKIEKLNITEKQKNNIKGWLKFTKLKPKSLHLDKFGNIYKTGYSEVTNLQITFRIFENGLCDMEGRNINLNEYELIHEF